MKKEWLLVLASTVCTVLIALALIHWLAPGLLGVSPDLQLVQVAREIPPFYESVFRAEDFDSSGMLVQDPITVTRGRPLFEDRLSIGPHDVLGFRNRAVPATADIITIGDSQTYGNNAVVEENWPSRIREYLSGRPPTIYNMSCGAWSGPQYLEILSSALRFRPRVIVVAFYTGNDPLGAFTTVYGSDRWSDLRMSTDLSKTDAPKVAFPAPPSQHWPVRFSDGTATVFTPELRLASNLRGNAAVRTGWTILGEVARRMNEMAGAAGVGMVYTIVPTKELVFAERIREERITKTAVYEELIDGEYRYLRELAGTLSGLPNAAYVDIVTPLQRAAKNDLLYPPNENGHPLPAGYDVIGKAIAPAVSAWLPVVPNGLNSLQFSDGSAIPVLVFDDGFKMFVSPEIFADNGWRMQSNVHVATPRDLATIGYLGSISTVEPERYGPAAFR